MFFEWEKLNPINKNNLVKNIGLKLYYVIYVSTTLFIVNIICLANRPTPDLIIYHLVQNLTASCFHHWSIGLTQRKLSMQCTMSMDVYAEEAWKPSLYIIPLTGGIVAYSSITQIVSLNSCALFLFILVTFYYKIVEENFNFVAWDMRGLH